MTTDIQIFNSRGTMLPLPEIEAQLGGADDATRERFQAVKAAYDAERELADQIDATSERVRGLVREIGDLENYKRRWFPGQTAIQATREYLATERAKVTG